MFKGFFKPKDDFSRAIEACSKDNDEKKMEGLTYLRDYVESEEAEIDRLEIALRTFMDKCSSRYDDARAMAVSGIGRMVKKNLVPFSFIEPVLLLMIAKADDRYETTRCNAIWCINNFADGSLIPPSKLDDVLVLMINKLNERHDDTRSNAIWCIGKLAYNNQIPTSKIDQVIVWMVTKADDRYDLARINVVGCLSRLASNNMISPSRAEKVLSRMLIKTTDKHDAVRSNALSCISSLAYNNLVPPSKIDQVVSVMLKSASSKNSVDARIKALTCIYNVAQFNVIPATQSEDVLLLMLGNANSRDENIRYNCIWSICDLAENGLIPSARVEDVLVVMVNAVEDRKDTIRCNAIRCISSFTEANLIPTTRTRMVFMLMIAHMSDDNDDARAMSIICIGNLVKNNRIPLSKMDKVLTLMLGKLDDSFDDARSVAMWCIGHLAKNNRVPANKIEEVLVQSTMKASDAHDGVRSNSIWCIAALAENNLIPLPWIDDVLKVITKRVKDDDVGVRVTACFCISFLCRRTHCDLKLVGRCVALLLSLGDNDDWKYRGIEGLCSFAETNLYGLTDDVSKAIIATYQLGDAFYDHIPSHSRKLEVASRINRAIAFLANKEKSYTLPSPPLEAPAATPTLASASTSSPAPSMRRMSPQPAPPVPVSVATAEEEKSSAPAPTTADQHSQLTMSILINHNRARTPQPLLRRASSNTIFNDVQRASSPVASVDSVPIADSNASASASVSAPPSTSASVPRDRSPAFQRRASSGGGFLGDQGWSDKASFERWRSIRKSTSMRLDDYIDTSRTTSPAVEAKQDGGLAPIIESAAETKEVAIAPTAATTTAIASAVTVFPRIDDKAEQKRGEADKGDVTAIIDTVASPVPVDAPVSAVPVPAHTSVSLDQAADETKNVDTSEAVTTVSSSTEIVSGTDDQTQSRPETDDIKDLSMTETMVQVTKQQILNTAPSQSGDDVSLLTYPSRLDDRTDFRSTGGSSSDTAQLQQDQLQSSQSQVQKPSQLKRQPSVVARSNSTKRPPNLELARPITPEAQPKPPGLSQIEAAKKVSYPALKQSKKPTSVTPAVAAQPQAIAKRSAPASAIPAPAPSQRQLVRGASSSSIVGTSTNAIATTTKKPVATSPRASSPRAAVSGSTRAPAPAAAAAAAAAAATTIAEPVKSKPKTTTILPNRPAPIKKLERVASIRPSATTAAGNNTPSVPSPTSTLERANSMTRPSLERTVSMRATPRTAPGKPTPKSPTIAELTSTSKPASRSKIPEPTKKTAAGSNRSADGSGRLSAAPSTRKVEESVGVERVDMAEPVIDSTSVSGTSTDLLSGAIRLNVDSDGFDDLLESAFIDDGGDDSNGFNAEESAYTDLMADSLDPEQETAAAAAAVVASGSPTAVEVVTDNDCDNDIQPESVSESRSVNIDATATTATATATAAVDSDELIEEKKIEEAQEEPTTTSSSLPDTRLQRTESDIMLQPWTEDQNATAAEELTDSDADDDILQLSETTTPNTSFYIKPTDAGIDAMVNTEDRRTSGTPAPPAEVEPLRTMSLNEAAMRSAASSFPVQSRLKSASIHRANSTTIYETVLAEERQRADALERMSDSSSISGRSRNKIIFSYEVSDSTRDDVVLSRLRGVSELPPPEDGTFIVRDIGNGHLPSVKETIDTFETMIEARHMSEAPEMKKIWSEKKYREH